MKTNLDELFGFVFIKNFFIFSCFFILNMNQIISNSINTKLWLVFCFCVYCIIELVILNFIKNENSNL